MDRVSNGRVRVVPVSAAGRGPSAEGSSPDLGRQGGLQKTRRRSCVRAVARCPVRQTGQGHARQRRATQGNAGQSGGDGR